VQPGLKVRTQPNPQAVQAPPANDVPENGPNQYGDQSIVNQQGGSTQQQKGKSGPKQPKQSKTGSSQ
jgi:hypothetical protein